MLHFLKFFPFVIEITWFRVLLFLTLPMNWQDMYEVALERIRQLNAELAIAREILRSYLPIVDNKEIDDEKR